MSMGMMGGGGVCPMCGQPIGGMSGGMGLQDQALMAMGSPQAGVQAVPGGGGMQEPMASLTPEQAAYLLQMLQATGGGHPAPQAQGPMYG